MGFEVPADTMNLDASSKVISKYTTSSSGNINKKDFASKSKEYSSLGEIIKSAEKYLNFENEKKELDKMLEEQNIDKEMKEIDQK